MARRTPQRTRQVNTFKQCWEWANNTDPENITSENIHAAYRVSVPSCIQGACRRNCKANPNCFNCLGERFWLNDIKDEYWFNCDDPEIERRPENAFVGLRNLGATCYVNTFLQVWFHNPVFRSAMYNYISPTVAGIDAKKEEYKTYGLSTSVEASNITKSFSSTSCNAEHDCNVPIPATITTETSTAKKAPLLPSNIVLTSSNTPMTVCGHLQLLFAQLQYSCRRYIDPSPFVDSLGLDTAQQQDAQEFSKLFTSLLEETLSHQMEPKVRNVIQDQFGGEYFYVTECHNCGNKSKRLSRFYELDLNIQGHSSLNQCIKEFVKEEKLDGDNQYYCNHCTSKQNAARYIELHSLPPVLNLQLLRFVFDRKTGYKKKLNSFIQFPDTLEMKDHVKNGYTESNLIYELSAVLIHFGVSAYSGHYVAHIRDKSGSWYKFNDEDIVKMQGSLRLSQDEDAADTSAKPTKRPKCAKGFHVSKNAYTLVYTRQGYEELACSDLDAAVPPPHVEELVATDNSQFEHWVVQVKEFRENLVKEGQARQAEIRRTYKELPANTDSEYEWITTAWLKDWMNDKVETRPVDNSSLLCSHGKLHPNQVFYAKRISMQAANVIFSKYGGLPRLQSDSLCVKCVMEHCRRIRFESRLAEDYKFVLDSLKLQTPLSDKFYWVGRRSLVRWKSLAVHLEEERQQLMGSCHMSSNQYMDDEEEDRSAVSGDLDMSVREAYDDEGGKAQKNHHDNTADEEESDSYSCKFNEDLLCEHGNLCSDESCQRLVPYEIWQRLKFYFPSAPEFPSTHPVCKKCQAEDEEERQKSELYKMLASEQRTNLNQLYHERNRPQMDEDDPFNACAVAKDFLDRWRQFLRFPTRHVPPSDICNSHLLCPHDKFLFDPVCDDQDGASEVLSYIWQHEWMSLTQIYPHDHEINVTKNVTEDGERKLLTNPEVCKECSTARIQQRIQHVEHYRYATIYVRKITKDHNEKDIQEVMNDSISSQDGYSFDPDFQSRDSKKPKLSHDKGARRSSRHRKQRGEVSLMVGSTETLRDIKLQVLLASCYIQRYALKRKFSYLMRCFSVMPMDQHLILNGTTLTDDKATLATLGIKPSCLLLLEIDEPQGTLSQDALPVSSAPEEGFKGTGLLGH